MTGAGKTDPMGNSVDGEDRGGKIHSGHRPARKPEQRPRSRLGGWTGRKSVASDLGIPKAYGSYEDLLADPDIDAIYNPLPNHLHVPLTIQAVEAGKHVLCEKPVALNAEEARQLLALPKDRLVAEGFMVRAHPQWIRAREIIRSGELGELRAIQSFFQLLQCRSGQHPQHARYRRRRASGYRLLSDGGGALFL